MFIRLFGRRRCKVHHCPLELDHVPVQYGLVRLREEFLAASREKFPNARSFVLGGCRVGPPRSKKVVYCPDCRQAEREWNEEHPEFDTPENILEAVRTERRNFADSPTKRLLKQSQLEVPERVGPFQWLVYRLESGEGIVYHSKDRAYLYPFQEKRSATYESIRSLARVLAQRQ